MLSLKESLKILKETNALIEGHFILSSGLHSSKYVQCAQLMSKPKQALKICKSLADKIKVEFKDFDLILSPAMGGIIVGYELGKILNKQTIFSERVNGEYRKSTDNFNNTPFNTGNQHNNSSNSHYETHENSCHQMWATTTPYKEGAIIYYAVRNDVIDWVEADIQAAAKGLLEPANTAKYTAQHTVTQADIDAGNLLSNQVTVTATMVKPETSVSVGDIFVTGSLENPVETTLNSTTSIDVTKVADVSDKNGDGYTNTGDEVTYTVEITNTGTQTITGLDVQDTLSDLDGNLISNPDLTRVPININEVYHSSHLEELHKSY